MNLYKLTSGFLSVNSYILSDEDKNAVIIDSGEDYGLIKNFIAEKGLNLKAVLLTHAHFDHVGNCKRLQEAGVKIYVSEKDKSKLISEDNLGGKTFETFVADYTFKDEDELTFGKIKVKVMETAGHTDGSVIFIVDDMIFSGDTLFSGSIGRTDFVSGSALDMEKSLRKICALKGDYKVFPGHGENTTLEREKEVNPYLKKW